jgi:phage terminase large subunit
MDFGFTAPSTLIKTAVNEYDMFIDEIFYRSGMTDVDFEQALKTFDKRDRINADSEDQRMINYLKNTLHYNIFAAKKPAGSVEFGISYLQARTINITKRSLKTIYEFRNLMHATDSDGKTIRGKYVGDDHAIDAVRYSLEEIMKPKSSFGGAIAIT